jgi:hypothetical protein
VVDLLVAVFFSLGAMLLYVTLFQSKLVPRFISVWGFLGAALILTLNLFSTANLFEAGMGAAMIFALPIITNEMFLGLWLIVKGFNPSVSASSSEYTPGVVAQFSK